MTATSDIQQTPRAPRPDHDADALLSYSAKGSSKDKLHLPGPDFVDRKLWPRPTVRPTCCETSSCS